MFCCRANLRDGKRDFFLYVMVEIERMLFLHTHTFFLSFFRFQNDLKSVHSLLLVVWPSFPHPVASSPPGVLSHENLMNAVSPLLACSALCRFLLWKALSTHFLAMLYPTVLMTSLSPKAENSYEIRYVFCIVQAFSEAGLRMPFFICTKLTPVSIKINNEQEQRFSCTRTCKKLNI